MKLLFAAGTALSLFITGLVGLTSASAPTVTSIHAFEEPLVAIGGDKSVNQDAALIAALQAYQHRKSYEDVSAITTYLDANPQSPWKFSLLANLGIVYRKTGYFSRAADAWEQAWALGKGEKSVQVQALSNRAAAELATLLSSLGRTERLDSLLAETKGRTVYGGPFNADVLSRLVSKWMEQARLNRKGSCHLLRHTCATHMLEGGADIRYIQQLLGHEKLETTAIYTEVNIRQLQEVHLGQIIEGIIGITHRATG
jgi:tetratricopeptide (TPR) repeat protein